MKKHVLTFLAALTTVFLFSQCQKDVDENKIHSTYFWTSVNNEEQSLTLFLDGQAVGQLPYFSTPLTCGNDSLKNQALTMNLKSGKYILEAKDSQGNIKSDCTLKISDSGLGVGPGKNLNNPGKSSALWESSNTSPEGSNSCVIVNLFY